jgi:tetratricopeptide (TPR) repeat protein
MEAARRHRLDRKWGPALDGFDRAALKLMEIRSGRPEYRSAEVHRRLQECRDAIEDAREESARAQYDELSADLEARLKRNPDDADALVSLGAIRRRRGDVRGAIDCFRRAVDLRPDSAEAWHLRGAAAASAGDQRSAELCLRKAVERAPQDAQVRYDLGLVQRELGEYEAARASFEAAAAADPSFASAWFSLGRLYQSALSDRARAAECWERYLRLKPDAPEAQRIREWIDRQRGPAEIRASTAAGGLAPAGGGVRGWGDLFRRGR